MNTRPPNKLQDLARAAQADLRDHQAVDRFFVELRPLVRRVCETVVANKPTKHKSFDIDDLVQVVTVKVWKKLPTYDSNRGSVWTWTRKIAHGTWRDLLRGKATEQIEDEQVAELASNRSPVDEQVNARLSLRLLQNKMEPKAFAMLGRNAAGSSPKDIAREDGTNVNTEKKRVWTFRACALSFLSVSEMLCATG